jgi:hypothetical protein
MTTGGYREIEDWSCEATTRDQYSGNALSIMRNASVA